MNKCDDPVSVTASMDVPDLYITWSHTYTSDDIVEVPGFTASVPSVVSAGVYVQVGLTPNNNELRLTVGTSNMIHDKKNGVLFSSLHFMTLEARTIA